MGSLNLGLGNMNDSLATRLAYKLNLRGPAFSVQCFCSTSLVAVHLGCQSLLSHDSDMVLAGGVTIAVPQKVGYQYQEGGILSPDGHTRTFDAKGQGMVFGNGLGIVVLKRLKDAIADGDSIQALILGSAINNDGSLKVGYTAPSVNGQAEVIVRALTAARVKPGSWPAFVPALPLPYSHSFSLPGVFEHQWKAGNSAGNYVFVLLAAKPGSLADNMFDTGDILSVATAVVNFQP